MQHKPIHIVVADDDDDDQFIIKEAISEFTDREITVTPVYDGAQLMDYLNKKSCFSSDESRRPDLILLDINMPVVNGMEALQKLKDDPQFREIPVCMISTVRCDKHYTTCIGMGAVDFYSKPNHIGAYKNIIETIFMKTVYLDKSIPGGDARTEGQT
jgi:CheY-like chemotaxis protein